MHMASDANDHSRTLRQLLGSEYPFAKIDEASDRQRMQIRKTRENAAAEHSAAKTAAVVIGLIILVVILVAGGSELLANPLALGCCAAPIIVGLAAYFGLDKDGMKHRQQDQLAQIDKIKLRSTAERQTLLHETLARYFANHKHSLRPVCTVGCSSVFAGHSGVAIADYRAEVLVFVHTKNIRKICQVAIRQMPTMVGKGSGNAAASILSTAAVGGLLFGGAGAVVGAITGSHIEGERSKSSVGADHHLLEITTRLTELPVVHVDFGANYAACVAAVQSIMNTTGVDDFGKR
ncbi:MAG: hypothetical protein R3B57_01085 [Phycisphaerales bacterium]